MTEQEFNSFLYELTVLRDNKAIKRYLTVRDTLTSEQRITVLETFLIACIEKIAKLEHVTNSK